METLTLFPFRISATQDIQRFIQCPYKWYLERVCRWAKPSPDWSEHLEFGKAFAHALELTRIAYYKEGATVEEATALGLKYLTEDFATDFTLSGSTEQLKTPAKAEEVFRRYFEEKPLDSKAVQPFLCADNEMSVEKQFEVELPFKHPETGEPLVITAKSDMLGINPEDLLVLVDEKTAKQSGMGKNGDGYEKTKLNYLLGNQQVQYAFVINQNADLIGEKKVTHCEIRVVVTTAGKLKAKTKAGGIPKNTPFVEVYTFQIEEWHQLEWWENTLLIVEEMLAGYAKLKAEKARPYRKSYGNCISYFKPCQYAHHCTSIHGASLPRLGFEQIYYDKDTDELISLWEKRVQLN